MKTVDAAKPGSRSASDPVEVSDAQQETIDRLMKPAVEQSYDARRSRLRATAEDRGGAWVVDPFQSPQWFSAQSYSLLDDADPNRIPALLDLAGRVLGIDQDDSTSD